jgi:hypothetical protein
VGERVALEEAEAGSILPRVSEKNNLSIMRKREIAKLLHTICHLLCTNFLFIIRITRLIRPISQIVQNYSFDFADVEVD